MLAALISGVLLGLANPGPGCLADKLYVSKISTFGIFVISGQVSHVRITSEIFLESFEIIISIYIVWFIFGAIYILQD